ncbi:biotin-dependent carboxyltransferase family protein [Pedococcus sp. 5OH_020]|uniref:5-oxoprolinase subunit C family protein n=1 Tax=Pedococcus sp. 5OH_020 TaxID=2989814 RepID=UPI0022E9B6BB|nr:biotin-dependent carboxyltransferase family protein [Pedococcus sp. 5OH_020]
MTSQGVGVAAFLEVVETGPLCLVQDGGRPGLSSLGVSPSGAADGRAFELGARLLGQSPAQAALECLLGGVALRAHGSVTVVVTGASCRVQVDDRAVGYAAPFLLRDGQVLRMSRPDAGLRSYLAVRGGLLVPPVLGSRSHDTLSGLGPPPVRSGDRLPVGLSQGDDFTDLLVDVAPVAPPGGGLVVLDTRPGPRWDWLADPAQLAETEWLVSATSDRVGVRLDGPRLLRDDGRRTAEVPSEGLVRGAVQLPPDGRPVVFLADHPVTGGYPVVAVLTGPTADAAAQVVPGQPVRLRPATSLG